MVICLQRDADLHMAQLMPLPLTISSFSDWFFAFLVPVHLGSPGKEAVKRVCVCVCCLTRALTQFAHFPFSSFDARILLLIKARLIFLSFFLILHFLSCMILL